MEGYEPLDILKQDFIARKYLHGIYAIDELSKLKVSSRPCFLIVNTCSSKSNKRMGHWLCLYLDIYGYVSIFFDSFGLAPEVYPEIKKFLRRHSKFIRYNEICLQHPSYETCGLYVIYFAKYITRGYDLHHILSFFPPTKRCSRITHRFMMYN